MTAFRGAKLMQDAKIFAIFKMRKRACQTQKPNNNSAQGPSCGVEANRIDS
jgi:hypothetical protein